MSKGKTTPMEQVKEDLPIVFFKELQCERVEKRVK
jgi:hypothetical protein